MIKATFPEGVTAMTVNGLHQWDYGQTLQIKASGLPALVEVHFACDGMKDAVVRSCAVTSDTLTAAIPDVCLEQTSPVMAWVYIVGESSGITTLTVTLPIIARARPQPNATVPTDTSDKYTEAIAAMNAAINSVSTGNFTTARAISDGSGNNIPDTYATKEELADAYATKVELADALDDYATKEELDSAVPEKATAASTLVLPSTLAGSATYQNGAGTKTPNLEAKTLYLVEVTYQVLSINYSASGVFYHSASGYIHRVAVGDMLLGLKVGSSVSLIDLTSGEDIDSSTLYTIKLYKMGSIS